MIALVGSAMMLIVLAGLLILGIHAQKRSNKYARLLQVEQTRAVWADARRSLMAIALRDTQFMRTNTFEQMYHLQTFVMRRPDEFDEIAKMFYRSIVKRGTSKRDASLLHREARNWPAGMSEVVAKMNAGYGQLIHGHLNLFRRVQATYYLALMRLRARDRMRRDRDPEECSDRKPPTAIKAKAVQKQLETWDRGYANTGEHMLATR